MTQPDGNFSSPIDSHETGYRLTTLTFWDFSKYPSTNDRKAKRGAGAAVRGVALEQFDEKLNRRKFGLGGKAAPAVDQKVRGDRQGRGLTPSPAFSIHDVDPDNWVPMLYEPLGKGDFSKWSVRLIADNTNPDSSILNSGTLIVDQENSQRNAQLNDLFQVSGREAPVDGPERSFNGAAFLDILYPKERQRGGFGVHNQLALKLHSNQGLITDGGSVGPLAHIISFKGQSGKGGGPGKSAIGGKGGAGGTGAGGRPAHEDEVVINADAGFKWPDGALRSLPEIEKAPEDAKDAEQEYPVHFFEGNKLGEKIWMARDANSNFSQIVKTAHPAIAGFIKGPRNDPPGYGDSPKYDGSYHSPPPGKPDSSSSGSGGNEGGEKLQETDGDVDGNDGQDVYDEEKAKDPMKPNEQVGESEEAYQQRIKDYWDRINMGEPAGPFPTRQAGHGFAISGTP